MMTLAPISVTAQSNQVIDGLLEQEQAAFGRVLYLVQTAAGELDENVSPQQAAEQFDAAQWNVPGKSAEEPVTLGEYSQILMRALDIPGGIMYSMFPGPRYAAREIAYLGFVRGSGAPGRTVSGNEVMYILGRVLEWKEGQG
jgi:hypothetical protein